jgi:tRNA U34 2-thiouridine synthase MnmA/TrmU
MTRYRAPLNFAIASYEQGSDELRLRFESPERAVAPGQLVALYDTGSDEVLAAATIRAGG